MATRKVNKGGRPKQGPEAASLVVTTRWTPSDKALLETLIASERARLEAAGIMSGTAARVAAADVLRSLVRQEAERRGLLEAPVAQAS